LHRRLSANKVLDTLESISSTFFFQLLSHNDVKDIKSEDGTPSMLATGPKDATGTATGIATAATEAGDAPAGSSKTGVSTASLYW